MSTFKVEVVPVELEPHPDADALSVVRVYGYTCCVRTEDWQSADKGAYIPPDSIVPETPQFAFLGEHRRIKARRMRGVWSMGLLVPAPDESAIGDDVADVLGVTHWEPPISSAGGEDAPAPAGIHPTYDVENMRRFTQLFTPGEPVVATEKVHGANGRWCYVDGQFHAGSRTRWNRESPTNLWWRALRQYPALMAFLRACPCLTAYGEVYGSVQSLKYGHAQGKVSIALFDLWCDGSDLACGGPHWVEYAFFSSACTRENLPRVPELYNGPFDLPTLEALAEGDTVIGNGAHIREGIVVRPHKERYDLEAGRVQLKLVSNRYLEKS